MDAKNIFRMEMYKNFRDKPYVIIIIILASICAMLAIIGAVLAETGIDPFVDGGTAAAIFFAFFILTLIITFFSLLIFSLLYPFHLLNVDYKNKVMSLMVASGVSRLKYYFVKISATLLSCFIVAAVISFIPLLTLFIVIQDHFVRFFVEFIHEAFTAGNIIQLLLSYILNIIQFVVVMFAAVIISRGKFIGIFLFIGFNIGISMVHGFIRLTFLIALLDTNTSFFFHEGIGMILTVMTIGLFGLLGAYILNKQDL